jgi:hypothetical protein
MTPSLQTEQLPPAVLASDALAAGEIKTYEYNAAIRVAEYEMTEQAKAITLPFCEATWGCVRAGDVVLVARYGLVEKVLVAAVEHRPNSVLADYVIGVCFYHGMLYAPGQPAFIQQR